MSFDCSQLTTKHGITSAIDLEFLVSRYNRSPKIQEKCVDQQLRVAQSSTRARLCSKTRSDTAKRWEAMLNGEQVDGDHRGTYSLSTSLVLNATSTATDCRDS